MSDSTTTAEPSTRKTDPFGPFQRYHNVNRDASKICVLRNAVGPHKDQVGDAAK